MVAKLLLRASGVCPALHSPALHSPAVSEFFSSDTFFSYLTFSWQPHLLRLQKQANLFMAAVISEARICTGRQLPRLPSLSRPQAPSYPCVVPLSRAVVSPTPTCIVILMESGRENEEERQSSSFVLLFLKPFTANSSTESFMVCLLVGPISIADFIAGFFLLEALGKLLRLLLESSHMTPSLHSGAYSTFPEVSVVLPEAPAPLPYIIHHGYPLATGPPSRLPIWMLPLLILPEASLSSATGWIMKTMARL